jgi:ABC-type branched-subunit amino acid transport system substrate-binding protein
MFTQPDIDSRRLAIATTLAALNWPSALLATDALSALERQGRQIYQQGTDNSHATISASPGLTSSTLPATLFPCINCHGAEGEGKVEGSLRIPPITSNSLLASTHAPYNDNNLIQAISTGKTTHSQLDAAMPRYTMAKLQMTALIAYLKHLGSDIDLDPGLSQDAIQLGSVLPLTGSLQTTGNLLKATLQACIANANAHGLIYGRRLSLITMDSGSTGEGVLTATQRLLNEKNTFAWVARYDIDGGLNTATTQTVIPDIAPITFMPDTSSITKTARFYMLPSYADQARALVDYALELSEFQHNKRKPSLALIIGEHIADKLAAQGVHSQAHLHGLPMSAEINWQAGNNTKAVDIVLAKKPDIVFFLGDMRGLNDLNTLALKAQHKPMLFSLMAMLGREVLQSTELAFSAVYLATPFFYNDTALQYLEMRLKPHGIPLQNPGLQSIVCAGVDLIVEGLMRSGKHTSRQKLLTALQDIRNFPVDFLPPLNFSPNVKTGIQGAYVLGITQRGEPMSQSAWITPSNNESQKP